jgi:SAM-dependent methyltransferase
VLGIDPASGLLDRARELAAGISNLHFESGDGRDLPLASESFDVVVFHTCLCHVPGPEQALAEAHRVLRSGGWLAIFDGDYVTTTVATGAHDPLQVCIDAAVAGLVHDPWLVRRLPELVRSAGFDVWEFQSHSYVQTLETTYMQSLVERGAESLVTAGRIGVELANALQSEGRRRAQAGTFFGHIAYGSVVARKRD